MAACPAQDIALLDQAMRAQKSTRLDTDREAKLNDISQQLQVMHESSHTVDDNTTTTQEGAYYGDFLQSISNDITHFLAHQKTKKPPVQPDRCHSHDEVSTRITKRKSDKNSTKPRPKHIKRRNSSPP
ncbi:uncharacterized protein RHO25_012205 [Cercospora beticola]|uniref:Uncharacterized protein n=1 Tax=Cercospora beticola TaxID=122368 RepID=A0ABZ0P6P9_CERBT|nr:hypothetical protein RHO25_012205 [Cercospora beticola]